MNKNLLLLTSSFLLLLLLSSCRKSDFKTVKIGFIIEHPDYYIIPAVYDTIQETMLVKEAYNEGATFETVTEQVLLKERHTDIKLSKIQYINVALDAEEDLSCLAPCIRHLSSSEFEFIPINNSYELRSYQKVVNNGNGNLVEAQYEQRTFYRLNTDATLLEKETSHQEYLIKHFTIPKNVSFEDYWENQLINAGAQACGDINSYKILE